MSIEFLLFFSANHMHGRSLKRNGNFFAFPEGKIFQRLLRHVTGQKKTAIKVELEKWPLADNLHDFSRQIVSDTGACHGIIMRDNDMFRSDAANHLLADRYFPQGLNRMTGHGNNK